MRVPIHSPRLEYGLKYHGKLPVLWEFSFPYKIPFIKLSAENTERITRVFRLKSFFTALSTNISINYTAWAVCPSPREPTRCKSPTLFPGSSTCLNILLLVRLLVYRAARALHSTWDMNSHSSSSVITFYCSNSGSSRPPFHHTILKSLQPFELFEVVFLTTMGFSNIRKYWCWLKPQYSFSYPNISFLCKLRLPIII